MDKKLPTKNKVSKPVPVMTNAQMQQAANLNSNVISQPVFANNIAQQMQMPQQMPQQMQMPQMQMQVPQVQTIQPPQNNRNNVRGGVYGAGQRNQGPVSY